MSDIAHSMGSDLTLSSTGDLGVALGDEAVRERVLRRLLTNNGAYIWQLSYGGGLAGFVGQLLNTASVQATVQGQMLLEASVARQPLPSVSVSSVGNNFVLATITYVSATTGSTLTSSVNLGGP